MTKQNVRGRIIKSLGGFYYVADSEQKGNIIECRARGAFRQQNVKPCVGDWAQVELTPQGKGYVVEIEERKTVWFAHRLQILTSWCWWYLSQTLLQTLLFWTN